MSSSTGMSSATGAAVLVAAVVLGLAFVVGFHNSDDDQSFVDFGADWTQGRKVDVTISVGNDETIYENLDEGHLGVRRAANKGQVARILVVPHDTNPANTITCTIVTDEALVAESQSSGQASCFAEVVVE